MAYNATVDKMRDKIQLDYSPEKNSQLKQIRGVCFEDVALAIEEGRILDVIEHPNIKKYPNQKIYVVNINDYAYLVPFVKQSEIAFLKTIFPSRKLTKKYLQKDIWVYIGVYGMKNKIKKNKFFDVKLDREEKDLLASVERGEWKSVSNLKEEITFAKKAAANFLRKDARINIRISSVDLEHLRHKAVYEGLPYQTLIASILHKYAAGYIT